MSRALTRRPFGLRASCKQGTCQEKIRALVRARVPAVYVTERCFETRFAQPKMAWETGNVAYVLGLRSRRGPPFLQPIQVGAQEFFLQTSFRKEQSVRSAAAEEFSSIRAYYAYKIKSPDQARFQALQLKVLDQILRSTLSYQHSTQPNYSGLFFSTHCSYGLLVGLSLAQRCETYLYIGL